MVKIVKSDCATGELILFCVSVYEILAVTPWPTVPFAKVGSKMGGVIKKDNQN